jgi:exosortase
MAVSNSPFPEATMARALGPRVEWAAYGPAALIAASFVPILVLFGLGLWSRPHYQFFPLLVPGAVALGWRSWRRPEPMEPGSAAVAWSAAALGWILLATGVALVTPWFAALGALTALLGAAYAVGGGRLTRAVLPAWGLLWLAIPAPRGFDTAMIVGLQDLVSRWSSTTLDVLGVYHVMDGNVVEVGGRELLVDQACSGIYSLFALLAGTVFYVLWARTWPPRAVALAVSSVFWVLFGNVLRIVAVVVLSTQWGVEVASGWRHELLGLATFGLMLGLVLSTDRLMASVGLLVAGVRARSSRQGRRRRREEEEREGAAASRSLLQAADPGSSRLGGPRLEAGSSVASEPWAMAGVMGVVGQGPARGRAAPPEIRRTWVGSWAAAAAFGVLLLPQAILPGVSWGDLLSNRIFEERFAAVDARVMPERLGAYQRIGFQADHRDWDNSWGEYSRVWSYRGPARAAAVSIDYSFVGWHDLTACYRSRGWRLTSMRVEEAPGRPGDAGASGSGSVVVAEFVNIEGRSGYLAYALYDRRGRPLDPPGTSGALGRLRGRLASWAPGRDPSGRDGEVLSYQVQVFVGGESPPTPTERAAILALFDEARQRAGRLARREGVAP